MCSRDDQRDWAAENARRSLDRDRRRREALGLEWAMLATGAQKRAAQSVGLLYALLSAVRFESSAVYGFMGSRGMHKHFPAFAKALGLRGPFYRRRGRLCPAVGFAMRMDGFKPTEPTLRILERPYSESAGRKELRACRRLASELGVRSSVYHLRNAVLAFVNAMDKERQAKLKRAERMEARKKNKPVAA